MRRKCQVMFQRRPPPHPPSVGMACAHCNICCLLHSRHLFPPNWWSDPVAMEIRPFSELALETFPAGASPFFFFFSSSSSFFNIFLCVVQKHFIQFWPAEEAKRGPHRFVVDSLLCWSQLTLLQFQVILYVSLQLYYKSENFSLFFLQCSCIRMKSKVPKSSYMNKGEYVSWNEIGLKNNKRTK